MLSTSREQASAKCLANSVFSYRECIAFDKLTLTTQCCNRYILIRHLMAFISHPDSVAIGKDCDSRDAASNSKALPGSEVVSPHRALIALVFFLTKRKTAIAIEFDLDIWQSAVVVVAPD